MPRRGRRYAPAVSTASFSELGVESPTLRSNPPPAPTEPGARGGFAFQPGLEGMRGVAVLAVLVFHGGFSWASGGFLGVSTFFTLSGFLITTLLLRERSRSGSIGLKRFWARRFRRLMPAALVCLVGVLVFAATVATPAQMVDLRGDMIASLLYVANWRFIADGASYSELFAAPSPVLHFWSLAIEEQFYLVFPLVVAGSVALAKGSRRLLAGLLAIGTVGSIAFTASLAESSIDAAYYNTFSRAAELLLGALLAMVVALPITRRALDHGRATITVTVAGAIASVGVVWLWHTAAQTDAWLYRGGLAGYALLSTVLIVVAVERGPLQRVFSTSAAAVARSHLLRGVPLPLAHLLVAHPCPHRAFGGTAVRAAHGRDPRGGDALLPPHRGTDTSGPPGPRVASVRGGTHRSGPRPAGHRSRGDADTVR